jgi:hypothetical protein
METTYSFSIDFIIRKCKSDNKRGIIFVRITVNSKRKEISIKEQVLLADWDGSREIVTSKTTESKKINKTIENIKFRIKEKYRAMEDRGELITAESVKNAYLGVQNQQRSHSLVELLDYYKKIWQPKLKHGGFKNYLTTLAYIRKFISLHTLYHIPIPGADVLWQNPLTCFYICGTGDTTVLLPHISGAALPIILPTVANQRTYLFPWSHQCDVFLLSVNCTAF